MAHPRRRPIRPVGDLVGQALQDLGMPSQRLTRRVTAAWDEVAEPAWKDQARPERLVGGVLVIAVSSAALRDELAQFHRARLLDVLKAALPDVPLVGIRFSTAESGGARPGDSA